MNKINQDDFRNVIIPLATAKPDIHKKGLLIGLLSLYCMLLISYFTDGILTEYIVVEIGIMVFIMFIISVIYDYIYRCIYEQLIDNSQTGVVIGFSNKLLVLSGVEVLKEFETDEIAIREVKSSEMEAFFPKYTSVVECKKDGEVIGLIGIDKIPELEGVILVPNENRVSEDLEIIYDEEDNFENYEDDDDFNDENDIE